MRALGLDTTRDFIVLVLVDGDKVYFKKITESNKKHTSLLLPSMDALLTEHNLGVSDIDVFSAVVGPGSFTGIRVGVSTVNAIAYALDKKVVEVTSLELIAYNIEKGVALIDALHGNYYGGYIEKGKITEMRYFEQGDEIKGERYKMDAEESYAEAFAEIMKAKINDGDFKDVLFPLYLRESQAEREAKRV